MNRMGKLSKIIICPLLVLLFITCGIGLAQNHKEVQAATSVANFEQLKAALSSAETDIDSSNAYN